MGGNLLRKKALGMTTSIWSLVQRTVSLSSRREEGVSGTIFKKSCPPDPDMISDHLKYVTNLKCDALLFHFCKYTVQELFIKYIYPSYYEGQLWHQYGHEEITTTDSILLYVPSQTPKCFLSQKHWFWARPLFYLWSLDFNRCLLFNKTPQQ